MKQRERNDFTGFACDTCQQKFDDDHELQAHKKAQHAAKSGGQSSSAGAGPAGSTSKKPGVEPADHRETTELPPGAKTARTGRN
jgi:hypothetical protein